ncbi:MAG: hypothetical protein MT332_02710 [Candidatus Nitrosopumilus limneticus]|nr:hypothetical protein [Candidatus Nitrosopumilus limneticus]MDC4211943.1 hypothetical protein [Candidatus Nitrosopumilus limneticus]MDC4214689.1 hypothetical protein [Candidatus Nitrosopumilus limneticus]MDC4216242.1 hypothetical protein [Candidatus Nitrosopumilus limneticus]MDC4217915.1 hypothetical protein [Candidatus Nitrosopumilus limneticus]
MVKNKDDIPDWVKDEIENVKFEKPKKLKISGYVLEIYQKDNKIDTQLYEPVEDGRQIVTMDLPEKIKISELEKGLVYEFVFEQHKAPLSKKVSEFLEKEKEIEMNAIYDFKLKSIKLIDEGSSSQAPEDDIEE